jgi:hypothetical protein
MMSPEDLARLKHLATVGKWLNDQINAACVEAGEILDDDDAAIDLICNGEDLEVILKQLGY